MAFTREEKQTSAFSKEALPRSGTNRSAAFGTAKFGQARFGSGDDWRWSYEARPADGFTTKEALPA